MIWKKNNVDVVKKNVSPKLWHCLDCGFKWHSVERHLCPRCHNQGERDKPVKQWRFPMNIFFRSR